MALSSHPNFIALKNSASAAIAGDEAVGITSVSYDVKVDLLDVTDFKDTSGVKLKLAALRDGSISMDGDLSMTDAPQQLIWSSFASGATIYVTIHFNPSGSAGQKGFQVPCLVSGISPKGEVAGKNTVTYSFEFTGAPVAV